MKIKNKHISEFISRPYLATLNVYYYMKYPRNNLVLLLRSIGLVLLAVSGTILAAPVALPVALVSAAGYVAVAGGVISAVSQMTVNDEILRQAQDDNNKPRDGD